MIRVVLADDHRIFREGLKALLALQDGLAVVAEAETGEQALRAVHDTAPQVLVLDLAMPGGLSGLDVLRTLQQRGRPCATVVLSMLEDASSVAKALALGARGYVVKGASAGELCAAIRQVAAGRRYLHPAVADVAAAALARPEAGTDLLQALSQREQQVMRGVCAGLTSVAIAQQLHLSAKTVETYRSRLMLKLGVDSVPALVKLALREGWLETSG